MRPQCLITGADFYDITKEMWVHGDLWAVADSYVFNCVTNAEGACWQVGSPYPRNKVISSTTSHYFERRGVLVIAQVDARLNPTASEYLNRSPDHAPQQKPGDVS